MQAVPPRCLWACGALPSARRLYTWLVALREWRHSRWHPTTLSGRLRQAHLPVGDERHVDGLCVQRHTAVTAVVRLVRNSGQQPACTWIHEADRSIAKQRCMGNSSKERRWRGRTAACMQQQNKAHGQLANPQEVLALSLMQPMQRPWHEDISRAACAHLQRLTSPPRSAAAARRRAPSPGPGPCRRHAMTAVAAAKPKEVEMAGSPCATARH